MKRGILGWGVVAIFIVFPAFAGGEETPKLTALLPSENEISGWTVSEKGIQALAPSDLYKIMDGGATLYIQHGFRSFVGQTYKGPVGKELDIHIFDQKTPQNARELYEDPFVKPSRMKDISDLGDKARIDETPLFAYVIDFIQKGFFVRVIIQDRTEEGIKTATAFARNISRKIK